MIDSNSQFFAILTAVGEAKQANATALGTPWTFKEMAIGDANGTDPIPNRTQTKLINEWRRAPVNQVRTDPANPNIIITEQVIPPDVGGRWIREIGLFDADGDLVAVANCAPSFKPLLAQGTGKTQVMRMNFIVANTAQIVLKIDPTVVLATRQYVDDSLVAALPPDKKAGTFHQVTIDKRGVVVSGGNPITLAGYGITDAFTKPETTSAIQQAIANLVAASPASLDTLKELADALGNDPNFATTMTNALAGKAAKSTTLGGYGITDAFTKPETTSAIQQAIASLVASSPAALDTLKELADALGNDPNFATTMTNALARKADLSAVSQATENSRGTARVASQDAVNAGTDDESFVTSKKLRWGIAVSLSPNGYVAFPPWLGGFLLQWGYVSESQHATDYRAFTIPFPQTCHGIVMGLEASTAGGFGANFGVVTQIIDRTKFLWDAGGSWGGGGFAFYFAWGK